jgi:sulfopyruvate decarboxylase subunit beta
MKRIDIIKEVAKCDGLIVCNIGYPSRELYSLNDQPENFYMLGSMGLASSIGLGLAMSQEERVYVIDGDGSILMNLGTLATIANNKADNLCLVIIDNNSYGSTGNQKTYTAGNTDLEIIARGAGNSEVVRVKNNNELSSALTRLINKSSIIIVEAEPGNEKVPIIDLEPVEVKRRFMLRHVQ